MKKLPGLAKFCLVCLAGPALNDSIACIHFWQKQDFLKPQSVISQIGRSVKQQMTCRMYMYLVLSESKISEGLNLSFHRLADLWNDISVLSQFHRFLGPAKLFWGYVCMYFLVFCSLFFVIFWCTSFNSRVRVSSPSDCKDRTASAYHQP